jgi:hypothetical protein
MWTHPLLTWLQSHLMTPKFVAMVCVIGCWRGLRLIENARSRKQREVVESLMKQLLWSKSPELDDAQAELVAAIVAQPILDVGEDKAKRRVVHHWNRYKEKKDSRGASALLADVIDLPARWIEDVWSGRR